MDGLIERVGIGGAYLGNHSMVSQWARAARAARAILLV
jgi:hypothetical protein